MRRFSHNVKLLLLAALLAGAAAEARAEEWVFYGGSVQKEDRGEELKDWYVLNKLRPVNKSEAKAHHYFDRESVASNSPFPGGIVRVWEKFVFQKETRTYEEAREDIKREEKRRLGREVGPLDYGRLFISAVNRATKEVETLYEVNCDSMEFLTLEVNHYDREGERMTREAGFGKDLWIAVQPGTLMELLSKEICKP